MRKADKDSSEFFLSGRSTLWWLLGFSLVATTFSADTPNLVTDIVRQNGGAGNWVGVSPSGFNDRLYLCEIMAQTRGNDGISNFTRSVTAGN